MFIYQYTIVITLLLYSNKLKVLKIQKINYMSISIGVNKEKGNSQLQKFLKERKSYPFLINFLKETKLSLAYRKPEPDV